VEGKIVFVSPYLYDRHAIYFKIENKYMLAKDVKEFLVKVG
jgi:hypothetical protein